MSHSWMSLQLHLGVGFGVTAGHVKARLLEMFALRVPVFRQRFSAVASPAGIERFYRLCRAREDHPREPFAGTLECDETTFGGARHGITGLGGAAGKVTVFGVVKHNGCVKAIPIAARNHAEIMGEIQAHTCEGSLYYSDECQNYAMLRPRGGHVMICKEKGRPLKCDHINGIKCSWSYAKNSLYPLRGLPTKYLHLYLAEVRRLLNQRNEDLKPSLKQMPTTLPISCIKPVLVQEGLESPFEMALLNFE